MSETYSDIFSEREQQFSSLVSSVFFPVELILSNLRAKNDSKGGPGACSPGKLLKICQRHGLAVPRAGDRSYVTGSIGGWSRSHLTHITGGS